MSTLGINLRYYREHAAKLSQDQLAARLGLAQRAVGMWEAGLGSPPSESRLNDVATALGVTVDQLMRDPPERSSDHATTFGMRLAARRWEDSLTMGGLAKRVGVSLQDVVLWETDQAIPGTEALTKAAGVLGVSVNWLLNGEGNRQ